MGSDEDPKVAIARLEVQVLNLDKKIDGHIESHPINDQNKTVNRATYTMIAVGIITVFVQIWSTNAVISSTKNQPQQVGIERTFQGEVKP
jgi:hypothetical protein